MWGTDMSQTVTLEEGRAYVFVAVEHANSEIIGIHAARSANRFEALEPVRQGVHRCFGSIAPGVARGLKLRHDHGSNYMSGDFPGRDQNVWASRLRRPSCANRGQWRRRALHPNLEGELALGADVQNHRGTACRAWVASFAWRFTMKSWLVARHGYKTPARIREEQTMPRTAIDPTLAATLPLAA